MAEASYNSPAEIIAACITAAAGDWPVKVNYEPDRPDSVVTVYDTAGKSDGQALTTLFTHFGFQVRVRATGFSAGWQKADTIRDALKNVDRVNVNIDDHQYIVYAIADLGQVLALGKDVSTTKCELFTINGTVTFRRL